MRTNKGAEINQEVRCRVELAYGERMDDLLAGTPSHVTVKSVVDCAVMGSTERGSMPDVRCAFLYGHMRRTDSVPRTAKAESLTWISGRFKPAM